MIGQSLKTRLWVLGAVSCLGIAVLAFSAIWHAQHSKEILMRFVDQDIALSRSATSAYAYGLQSGQALRNILLEPGNRVGHDNLKQATEKFTGELENLNRLLGSLPDGRDVGDQLKAKVGKLQPLRAQILDLIVAGKVDEARSELIAKETPAWRAVRADLLDLVKRTDEAAAKERSALLDDFSASSTTAIVISLFAFVLVGGIALVLGRGVFRLVGGEPSEVADALQRIAQGDLTQRLHAAPGDTESILAATCSMQAQMHDLIAATVQSADAVVRESEAIRGDAEVLSRTAEEQSAATAAIAAAVEELTASISVMSGSAEDARRLSSESEAQGSAGLGVVAEATDTIQKVAEAMTGATATMEELSGKVTSINGIVQTIRDIADQTNLLALNAAIEAARAGEQGRGFAVVADEVRKLAERTTASTEEISQIVGGVCQTTEVAVQTMANAKTRAEAGAEHTQNVRGAVTTMADSSTRVGSGVEAIAAGLREQTAASTDIAQRVELIAHGIEETNAASNASSERTGRLVDLAHSLKESVQKFRV
ncbi:MAG TPA: methyl-accepting chemotaxis protein [Rhodocyclaceae bacterium]